MRLLIMMTRRSYLSALAVCVLLGAFSSASHAMDVGKPVPDFEIKLANGKTFKPADAKGEVVVVNLWATWCTYCRDEMPVLESYYQRHKAEGLQVIAVSMDEPEDEAKAREVMKAFSYTLGLGKQSKMKSFGRIWRLPMTFVIDRNGVLRKDGSEGEPKVDMAILEREVTPLLKR